MSLVRKQKIFRINNMQQENTELLNITEFEIANTTQTVVVLKRMWQDITVSYLKKKHFESRRMNFESIKQVKNVSIKGQQWPGHLIYWRGIKFYNKLELLVKDNQMIKSQCDSKAFTHSRLAS